MLPVLFFLADPWAPARNSVYFGLVSSSLFWITRYSVPSQGEEFFLPLTFRSPLSKAIALARSTDHGNLSHWLCNYISDMLETTWDAVVQISFMDSFH